MAFNVGKSTGMVFVSENEIISFHNVAINNDDQDLKFFRSKNQTTPLYTLSSSLKNRRCLHYNIFSPTYSYEHKNHIVLYEKAGMVQPLYETINVNAYSYENATAITFWSVLRNGQTTKIKLSEATVDTTMDTKKTNGTDSYVYIYDSSKVYQFMQDDIDDYQLQDSYKNIFCSAEIVFEYLYVGTNTAESGQLVPVIHSNPRVLQQIDDMYPVVDFAIEGQGNGGGMKQHQHIPYVDGTSYAFAVFHPGTSMPQLSWLSV